MTDPKFFFVYVLTNHSNKLFYVGVTSDLIKRLYQHKNHLIDGFTKKYNIDKIVYFESCPDAESAIRREKRLKRWNRAWKIQAIEAVNPEWKDLYDTICS